LIAKFNNFFFNPGQLRQKQNDSSITLIQTYYNSIINDIDFKNN